MNRFQCSAIVCFFVIPALTAQSAELRRAPYLQVPTSTSMTIRWRTDDSVRYTSVVRFGKSPDKLESALEARELPRHFPGVRDWQATIDKLEPDTKYYYALEADRATLCGADEQHWFRTAPPIGKAHKLRFWLLGDSGSNRPRSDDLKTVLAAKAPMDPILVRNGFRKFNKGQPLDGIILLGDNSYPTGTDEQYQASFFNVYADELRHTPLWPCTGNHDLDDAYKYLFTTNARAKAGGTPSGSMFYYSADIANLHLVVLDPWKRWLEETTDEAHLPWKKQLAWFEKDLGATGQEWIVVVQHFPVYCQGDYNSDTNGPLKQLRARLVPMFDRHGVDLAVSGHDHTYQRSYLLHGHLGTSKTFDPKKHVKHSSDGRSVPMVKPAAPGGGTMYIVSGTGGGSRKKRELTHPAMIPFPAAQGKNRGLAIPSSLVLEFDDRTLRGWQVDVNGDVLDQFTMVHQGERRKARTPSKK
ncbi:MAG: metallophosphoesterase family protein [Planctomycetes bacterium]|nr:metallophosphoesterase family protein [Planctomycetota bacterium]